MLGLLKNITYTDVGKAVKTANGGRLIP